MVSRQGGWVEVANGDGSQTGWIYEKLLESTAAPDQQQPAAGSGQTEDAGQPQGQSEWVKVSGSAATVRSSPSDSASMLFAFPQGRVLRVMSRQAGWVQIMDPGSKQTGWIAESSIAAANAPAGQRQAATGQGQDAAAPPYDEAGGGEPGPEGAWLPPEEGMGPPRGMAEGDEGPRRWSHRRHGGLASVLRRAFGGY